MITSGINTDNEDGLSNINLAEEKIHSECSDGYFNLFAIHPPLFLKTAGSGVRQPGLKPWHCHFERMDLREAALPF